MSIFIAFIACFILSYHSHRQAISRTVFLCIFTINRFIRFFYLGIHIIILRLLSHTTKNTACGIATISQFLTIEFSWPTKISYVKMCTDICGYKSSKY